MKRPRRPQPRHRHRPPEPGRCEHQERRRPARPLQRRPRDQQRYAYATLQATRTTRLPGRWTLGDTLILQYAGDALPETEQLALGGVDLVRGYTIDNGAFDSAVVLRNELRAPSHPLLQPLTRIPDALSPYAFIDAAYGSSRRIGESARLASLGVGADYARGAHATLSASAVYRVADRVPDHDRSLVIQARATATF